MMNDRKYVINAYINVCLRNIQKMQIAIHENGINVHNKFDDDNQ